MPRPFRGALLVLPWLAACLAAACGGGASASPLLDGSPRHLLLVTLAGVRADHTSAYRYVRPTTAWHTDGAQRASGRALALDDLAASGLVCAQAWSPAEGLLSSLKALFSGRPTPLGEELSGLSEDVTTLAERLGQRGFRTAAFVSGPELEVAGGFDQGFAHFLHRESDESALRWAVSWLLGNDFGDGQPLFLWVHLSGPQPPWTPGRVPPVPGPSADKLDYLGFWIDQGLAAELQAVDFGNLYAQAPQAQPDEVDRYDGELAQLSSLLRSFLLAYRSLGRQDALLEDTALVVAGVGGAELGEHGWGSSLYAPYARVPLIFHHPRTVPPRRYSSAMVSLDDVAPTALDWLGLEPAPAVRPRGGRSLLQLLARNRAPRERPVVTVGRGGGQRASLRDGRHTLVWTNGPEGETAELYDRGLDPLELRDVASLRPNLARELRNDLVWLLTEVDP